MPWLQARAGNLGWVIKERIRCIALCWVLDVRGEAKPMISKLAGKVEAGGLPGAEQAKGPCLLDLEGQRFWVGMLRAVTQSLSNPEPPADKETESSKATQVAQKP